MHFGQLHSQLLPFCEYVFAPPVEEQSKVRDILLRKVYVVYIDWRGADISSCGECDMGRLGFISFILHVFNHFCVASRVVYSFCEAVPDHCPWLIPKYRRLMLRLQILLRLAGLQ
jgi:hypothetical protein